MYQDHNTGIDVNKNFSMNVTASSQIITSHAQSNQSISHPKKFPVLHNVNDSSPLSSTVVAATGSNILPQQQQISLLPVSNCSNIENLVKHNKKEIGGVQFQMPVTRNSPLSNGQLLQTSKLLTTSAKKLESSIEDLSISSTNEKMSTDISEEAQSNFQLKNQLSTPSDSRDSDSESKSLASEELGNGIVNSLSSDGSHSNTLPIEDRGVSGERLTNFVNVNHLVKPSSVIDNSTESSTKESENDKLPVNSSVFSSLSKDNSENTNILNSTSNVLPSTMESISVASSIEFQKDTNGRCSASSNSFITSPLHSSVKYPTGFSGSQAVVRSPMPGDHFQYSQLQNGGNIQPQNVAFQSISPVGTSPIMNIGIRPNMIPSAGLNQFIPVQNNSGTFPQSISVGSSLSSSTPALNSPGNPPIPPNTSIPLRSMGYPVNSGQVDQSVSKTILPSAMTYGASIRPPPPSQLSTGMPVSPAGLIGHQPMRSGILPPPTSSVCPPPVSMSSVGPPPVSMSSVGPPPLSVSSSIPPLSMNSTFPPPLSMSSSMPPLSIGSVPPPPLSMGLTSPTPRPMSSTAAPPLSMGLSVRPPLSVSSAASPFMSMGSTAPPPLSMGLTAPIPPSIGIPGQPTPPMGFSGPSPQSLGVTGSFPPPISAAASVPKFVGSTGLPQSTCSIGPLPLSMSSTGSQSISMGITGSVSHSASLSSPVPLSIGSCAPPPLSMGAAGPSAISMSSTKSGSLPSAAVSGSGPYMTQSSLSIGPPLLGHTSGNVKQSINSSATGTFNPALPSMSIGRSFGPPPTTMPAQSLSMHGNAKPVAAPPVSITGSSTMSGAALCTTQPTSIGQPPISKEPKPSIYPAATVSHQTTYGASTEAAFGVNPSQQFGSYNVLQQGWNKGWGSSPIDLTQHRIVIPPEGIIPPKPSLAQQHVLNCSPDIFRSTLTKVPESQSLLQKSRLPFGILIHPFKDLEHLPVVSCSTIVRCRHCRTYINPFVSFRNDHRWECNLCFRLNDIPEEFFYDPNTQMYGSPARRPELQEATIEFVAPSEYMLRPPQPAAYLYVLDVSRLAVDTGYLQEACDVLLSNLESIPGDRRTLIGFITFANTLQFYLMDDCGKIQMLEIGDIDDVFLPSPHDLLVNLEECMSAVEDLLASLPEAHAATNASQSALGAALTAAHKMMFRVGGRVTVMTASLPSIGPGALKPREDPNQRSAKDISHLGPATDFYKRLALDCSAQQISVDLFTFNSQYIDLATLSGMSRFSGGCMHHFPGFSTEKNIPVVEHFKSCFRRYVTRKIGFEAVMRIRLTKGLSITSFHGNFFVRSTDLLSLPNVNPDAGYGMQITVEEPLHNIRQACFQAALLYTSSTGERRIRVHTLCLPVTPNVPEIMNSGDQEAIVALLSKLAVERCFSGHMSDAREATVNACSDALAAFKTSLSSVIGLPVPHSLQVFPLLCLALLKSVALRYGTSTKLDDRVYAMCQMKTLPLPQLMTTIYPDLYPIHNLSEEGALNIKEFVIPQPKKIHLSSEFIDHNGAFLMDTGLVIYVYIRSGVASEWIAEVLNVPCFAAIPQPLFGDPFPVLENRNSELLRNFLCHIQQNKPYYVPIYVIREDNASRGLFIQNLLDDRSEGAHSYVEFIQYIKSIVK